ncbi:MAG: hypothetical protein LBV43_15045 [Prevotella sp.]|jgi:hypothetical protein|nr:hypothetical protein [Prevotella sp.]
MEKEREKPEISRKDERVKEFPTEEPKDVPEISPTDVPEEPHKKPNETDPQATITLS